MQRLECSLECSFIKNGKKRKDRNILLKRTDAQPWAEPSSAANQEAWLSCAPTCKEHVELSSAVNRQAGPSHSANQQARPSFAANQQTGPSRAKSGWA